MVSFTMTRANYHHSNMCYDHHVYMIFHNSSKHLREDLLSHSTALQDIPFLKSLRRLALSRSRPTRMTGAFFGGTIRERPAGQNHQHIQMELLEHHQTQWGNGGCSIATFGTFDTFDDKGLGYIYSDIS